MRDPRNISCHNSTKLKLYFFKQKFGDRSLHFRQQISACMYVCMNKWIWAFLLMDTVFPSNCSKLVKLLLLEILRHNKLYGNFLNIFPQFTFSSIYKTSPRSYLNGKFIYVSNFYLGPLLLFCDNSDMKAQVAALLQKCTCA